jgi:hypothetical protein
MYLHLYLYLYLCLYLCLYLYLQERETSEALIANNTMIGFGDYSVHAA